MRAERGKGNARGLFVKSPLDPKNFRYRKRSGRIQAFPSGGRGIALAVDEVSFCKAQTGRRGRRPLPDCKESAQTVGATIGRPFFALYRRATIGRPYGMAGTVYAPLCAVCLPSCCAQSIFPHPPLFCHHSDKKTPESFLNRVYYYSFVTSFQNLLQKKPAWLKIASG